MKSLLSKATLFAVLALVAAGAASASAGTKSDNAWPHIDLRHGALSQKGQKLILTAKTADVVNLKRLERFPDRSKKRLPYLCFKLQAAGEVNGSNLCVGGPGRSKHAVGVTRVNSKGKTIRQRTVAATVRRSGGTKLVVAIDPDDAGLKPATYEWQIVAREGGPYCRKKARIGKCFDISPAHGGPKVFKLRPIRAVGCTPNSSGLVYNGSRSRKVVALTFDDGPSTYTPGFLKVLKQKHVHATFFELGENMPGQSRVMRRILAQGSELANHSMHHASYPGYDDLAQTSALIKSQTHFKPCMFRPPGGAVNSAVVSAAGQAGMKTIIWDVDTNDWRLPGSSSIYNTAVNGRSGSVILMHDGGGYRSQTLAALPGIIDTLRSRGFGFVTMSEMLGGSIRYRPYG